MGLEETSSGVRRPRGNKAGIRRGGNVIAIKAMKIFKMVVCYLLFLLFFRHFYER
jgi:hypothetical protein